MHQDNNQLCKDEEYSIVGYAIGVLNIIESGFPKTFYDNTIAIELK